MKTIKIKTKRFKRYSNKVANFKLESLASYKGTGENVRGFINYDPSAVDDNSPDITPIKTGYRTKSIKEPVI